MVGVTVTTFDDHKSSVPAPPPPQGPVPKYVQLLTAITVIGGFLFGYDCGVVAGAMVVIKDFWGPHVLTDYWQQWIVTVTVISAAVCSFAGAPLNDRFGRKPVILVSSVLFVVGSLIMGFAQNRVQLLVGRFLVGAGIGFSSMTTPMYIGEASPPHVRGRLITMYQLAITFGYWVAGLIDAAFNYMDAYISWRLMLGAAAIPAAMQLIGFIFMPETPRWLATHGKPKEAVAVLNKVCSSEAVAKWEFDNIQRNHEESEKEALEHAGEFKLLTMLKTPPLRRALIVAVSLMTFSQFTGINTVMYYSTSIIQMAGIKDNQTAIWLSTITSGVNFVCTFIGIYLVDRIGRRKLILGSTFGVIVCLFLIGTSFVLIANDSPTSLPPQNITEPESVLGDCYEPHLPLDCDPCSYRVDCGFCFRRGDSVGICMRAAPDNRFYSVNQSSCSVIGQNSDDQLTFANGWCPSKLSLLPVVGMVVYLCFFSSGLGPVPWTLNAEIFPHQYRSLGNAATAFLWLSNVVIALTFLTLVRAISRQGAFFLYGFITVIGWLVFYVIVPETQNKTLEELETLFDEPWSIWPCRRRRSKPRATVSYAATITGAAADNNELLSV